MIFVILILTLIGIICGANYLVDGSVGIARRFNISEFIIGALIVGVGTSMPELVVSTMGAWNNNADIAIGNVVGSNIFNILGILGLTALIFPIPIEKSNFKIDLPICLGVSLLLTLFIPTIGVLEGIILLLCFVAYTIYSLRNNTSYYTVIKDNTPIWKNVLKIIGGLCVLIISCDIFIDKSVVLAKQFGLSDAVISLTLIACGTSLPELASSIVSAFKKNTQLALGNIVGSNIFNITFILGLSSQITNLTSSGISLIDYIIMILSVAILIVCGIFKKINRYIGLLMFLSFIAYTIYLIS